jgi:hypothetical protein
MTRSLFQFGQRLPEYAVPVLNERAVRASAGILFFFAIVAFMNAWLVGNFQPTRLFVVAFLVDFTIRLAINPQFAPSLILGQWVVRKQRPDYVGAPQKRFAWAIGFGLALAMLYLVVLNNVIGPVNLVVCSICLVLLFCEAAFGICIGCKIYNIFHQEQARLCPGDACALPSDQRSRVSGVQIAILAAFVVLMGGVVQWVERTNPLKPVPLSQASAAAPSTPADPADAARCKVPDFAKAMGHEEKWKLHNNCR